MMGPMTFVQNEYQAAPGRYGAGMPYRRTGVSGLDLPAISLGLWHNFGDDVPLERQQAILRRAFDRGVTHFDLANNYGPPYGSAERNFGTLFARDFRPYRDELIISSKAGWDMWPGPYGQGGGSRKYVIASCDQSLGRLGLDYVDIFYSHRFDETTPLEETMGALDALVRAGKALYIGISSYSGARTLEAVEILRSLGTPLLIHQPSYSMLNRWVEDDGLLDVLGHRHGCIALPLGPRHAHNKYLKVCLRIRVQRRVNRSTRTSSGRTRSSTSAPLTDSPRSAASRWPRWRSRGCSGTRGSPPPSSARAASRNSTTASTPSGTSSSPPRS